MKKTGRLLIWIAFVLVCVLLNVILFLTVDDARLESGVFWMGWAFAFPWNLLIATAIFFWTQRGSTDLVKLPVALTVSYFAFAVYLVLGIIFMYCPINAFTVPLIIELTVTVVYVIVAMYAVYAATYVERNQKQGKQKVLYIRMLKADVDGCVARTTDPALIAALQDLSERVRFSDPMSHPSLAGVEMELSTTVTLLATALTQGETARANELIARACALLENRNSRCIMLK